MRRYLPYFLAWTSFFVGFEAVRSVMDRGISFWIHALLFCANAFWMVYLIREIRKYRKEKS